MPIFALAKKNTMLGTTTRFPIDLSLLAETFDIQVNIDCTRLKEWENAQFEWNDFQTTLFNYLLAKSQKNGNYWNEEELKVQFIGPLFLIADIEVEDKIKVFFERPISATIQGHLLKVVADCLVATPMQFNKPKKPYFFLQEYKKGRGDDKDPEAQMLTAMLIAQHQNQDNLPVYGSYVIGNNWRFTTLIQNSYCFSREYSAEIAADLRQIVGMIRKLKGFISSNSTV